MSSEFSRFENFGAISDAPTRKKIAENIHAHLASGGKTPLGLSPKETAQFAAALQKITSNATLLELCAQDESLATQITQELLGFINSTQRSLRSAVDPFGKEKELQSHLKNATAEDFEQTWKPIAASLLGTYKQEEIDSKFYAQEFEASFKPQEKGNVARSFDSIKSHLLDRWQALLTQKELVHQLELIEKERAKFVKDLYARAEELKKLKEALEPFTQELGRLWDMSKGKWQRVNFDLLKQYAKLLQQNEALQQLAEMLGKMRKAETTLEEELYKDIEIKTVWKVERAQKSELVGIKESDDLNNLLPGETALLSDPDLELLFYKRFAEKKLQVYDYQGKIKDVQEEEVERLRFKSKEDKKGPIIICVDTSGSMHGAPETVAKTLCFAILKIALQERRKCYLISFSTAITTIDLTDFQHSLDKLLDFLGMSFQGGTDASPALQESLRMLDRDAYKKADVLMISDFVMGELGAELTQKIKAAQENATRFHSLVIGASANAGVVKAFDNNWVYDPARPEGLKSLLKQMREI
jgi:uncharacterized protein with von Willebrand factor type A (vWA) domain